jgi:hypothetical protein
MAKIKWTQRATDNFNRADQDLNTGNWYGGVVGCKILSNVATGKAAGQIGISHYVGAVVGVDQYVEADLDAFGAGQYLGVVLRGPGGTNRCYMFIWNTFNNLQIVRYVGGVTSNPQSGPAGAVHPTGVGGRIRAEAVGTLLSLYWNGSLMVTATDNLYADGYPGVVSITQSNLWPIDNFAMGDGVAGRRSRHRGGELWGIIPEVASYLG